MMLRTSATNTSTPASLNHCARIRTTLVHGPLSRLVVVCVLLAVTAGTQAADKATPKTDADVVVKLPAEFSSMTPL
ncbi:MAG: hypothetical protein MI757_19775 [Pirellulales bacterium]|nr:hypothetical protein [Pirellulales bacterium]